MCTGAWLLDRLAQFSFHFVTVPILQCYLPPTNSLYQVASTHICNVGLRFGLLPKLEHVSANGLKKHTKSIKLNEVAISAAVIFAVLLWWCQRRLALAFDGRFDGGLLDE